MISLENKAMRRTRPHLKRVNIMLKDGATSPMRWACFGAGTIALGDPADGRDEVYRKWQADVHTKITLDRRFALEFQAFLHNEMLANEAFMRPGPFSITVRGGVR